MKKLIIIPFLFFCLISFGQRTASEGPGVQPNRISKAWLIDVIEVTDSLRLDSLIINEIILPDSDEGADIGNSTRKFGNIYTDDLYVSDSATIDTLVILEKLNIEDFNSGTTTVLSPDSDGYVDTLETSDITEITLDTLSADFIDITNDLDVGDTIEFDNGFKIYNTHADTGYIEETSVMIKGELNIKDLATSNTVLLTIDSNGDIDTLQTVPLFATAAMVGGTGDAITIDFTPDYPTLAAGDEVMFVAEANNTGAATLNIDGVGAVDIYEASDISALDANDIRDGMVVRLVHDGTRWQQISQSGN